MRKLKMMKISPIAKVSDYTQHEDGYYYLSGRHFKALGGAICDDPNEGVKRYNNNVLKLNQTHPMRERAINFINKHQNHYRLQIIHKLVTKDVEIYNISELSPINRFIYRLLMSFGQLEKLDELTI